MANKRKQEEIITETDLIKGITLHGEKKIKEEIVFVQDDPVLQQIVKEVGERVDKRTPPPQTGWKD